MSKITKLQISTILRSVYKHDCTLIDVMELIEKREYEFVALSDIRHALMKIDSRDCTGDVYGTLQAAVYDLTGMIDDDIT